jgi:hypothetical protein
MQQELATPVEDQEIKEAHVKNREKKGKLAALLPVSLSSVMSSTCLSRLATRGEQKKPTPAL